VKLSVKGDVQTLEAFVNNKGPVIAPHHLATLFKPLVQLPMDASNDRPSTSLGLGLYVAKEIAEAHGGDISASSDIALGTTLKVRIPKQMQEQGG
jgi:signal transduction histidine kinase